MYGFYKKLSKLLNKNECNKNEIIKLILLHLVYIIIILYIYVHIYNIIYSQYITRNLISGQANAYGDFLIGVKRDKWNWLDKTLIKFNLRYDAQCYQSITYTYI